MAGDPALLIAPSRGTAPDPQPQKPPASEPIFGRAIAFLVLLTALDLWASHHLGVGLSKKPGWLGVVITAWTAAMALLDRTLADEEKKSRAERIRRLLRQYLLATPALAVLALLLALISLSYSSVMLLAEPAVDLRDVQLAPAAEGDEGSVWIVAGDPDRFLALTGPFGRPYRLSLPGYLPAVVNVPALTGLKVVPERDLRRPASLLLRPPPVALSSLKNGGSIEVWVGNGAGRRKLATARCDCAASFLLGRRQAIPSDALVRWRLELLALSAVPEESPAFAQTLLAWRQPRTLPLLIPDFDLTPDTAVTVLVKSRADKIVARTPTPVSAGEESLLDILLE